MKLNPGTTHVLLFAIALALLVAVAVGIGYQAQTPTGPRSAGQVATSAYRPTTPNSEQPKLEIPERHSPTRVPAYLSTTKNLSLPPTLQPEIFNGNVRLAYQVAREIPETLAQLPCYCQCDRGFGHQSLHSCFVGEHGANCGVCIGEAIMAFRLEKEQKLGPKQIRERIIAAYGQTKEH